MTQNLELNTERKPEDGEFFDQQDATSGVDQALHKALALAAQGLPVFPCNKNKRPACTGGFKVASTDPQTIRELWSRFHGPLIGVPCGEASGIVVLDVDPRHDGDVWLEENRHRLPLTRIHHTRSGGVHYILRHKSGLRNSASKIAQGVDVRGDGGYIIHWPSAGYEVENADAELAPWPTWLDGIAGRKAAKIGATFAPHNQPLSAALAASEGARNNTAFASACQLLREGRTETEVHNLLSQMISPDFDESEITRVVESARHAITHETCETPARVALLCGADVIVTSIRWIWDGWLAHGKLHIFAGPAGAGKSTICYALAAAITRGATLPDGSAPPVGDCVIWSSEDDPSDTIAPRLIAMGADMKRIHFVQGVTDGKGKRPFDPALDLSALSSTLEALRPSFLLIDPIVSAVSGDSHKNAEVRRSLQPLVDLGAKLGCAIVGVSHFAKQSGGRSPTERVAGSLAFSALARLVWVASKGEDGQRVFVRSKSNIGPDSGGFYYELEHKVVPGHDKLQASCVRWGEAIEGNARDILNEAEVADENPGGLRGAKDFLLQVLTDGPLAASAIKRQAEDAGVAWRTIERAKRALGIKAHNAGKRCVLALPESTIEDFDPLESGQKLTVEDML